MIVITGASDGLGRELAKLFVSEGKHVIGLSRSKCDKNVEHVKVDLTNEKSISSAAKIINSKRDQLEALINCAGVLSIEKFEKLTASEVDRVFSTNIRAPLLLTSKLVDRIRRDGADVVNVASTVGLKGYKDQTAYSSSKFAMRGFSVNLQIELKDTNCRVISFCTGGFKSKLFEKATGVDNTTNIGEWMSPIEVAKLNKTILDFQKIWRLQK